MKSFPLWLAFVPLFGCLGGAPSLDPVGDPDKGTTDAATGSDTATDDGALVDDFGERDVNPGPDIGPLRDDGTSDTDGMPDLAPSPDMAPDMRDPCDQLPAPIAYWRMETLANGEVPDSAGTSTLSALNSFRVAGRVGQALGFDGDERVSTPHTVTFAIAEGTISFWFRVDDPMRQQMLFNKDAMGASAGHLEIEISNGRLHVSMENPVGGERNLTMDHDLVAGQWYHVAYMFRDSGGALALSPPGKVLLNNDMHPGWLANPEHVVLGFANGNSAPGTMNSPSEFLIGALDEVAIFDVALPQEDALKLSMCGVLPTP